MTDPRRIIIMSRLALYDKGQGRIDQKADRLFRRDYIYRQNMWTRFYASMVVIIGLVCYWVYRFFTTDLDIFGTGMETILTQSLIILGITLLIFTVIGTIKATADYQAAQGRLRRYYKLLAHLDRISTESGPETAAAGEKVKPRASEEFRFSKHEG